jgi:predicted metalloprotease with PDZ domain
MGFRGHHVVLPGALPADERAARGRCISAARRRAADPRLSPGPNSPNAGVSYYSKGALVALALDLHLRRTGKATLDDIVRAVWKRYGVTGEGLPEDGFEALAAEIAGIDLADFFAAAVRGTADPNLAELVADFGLELHMRPAEGAQDSGGTPPKSPGEPPRALGAIVSARESGVGLDTILDGGAADTAGLCPGDVVIALDGLRVTEGNLAARLARPEPGDEISVSFFRDDELLETRLVVQAPPDDTCYIELDETAGRQALTRRRAWLGE